MRIAPVVLGILAFLFCAASLPAALIPVGTMSGTLAVHYDADNPSNPSYYKLQFSPTNTNGAAFSFLPAIKPIFGDVGQFGLDAIYTAPTNDQVVPTLTAVDYNGVGPVPSAESIDWALNDYKPNSPIGPGNPANIPFNSLFRGPGIDLFTQSTVISGSIETVTVTGQLVSDGNINWFNPASGTTSLASVGLLNVFPFTATFTDDLRTDPGENFFSGTATFFAETPEPAGCILMATGLAGLLGFTKWRKRAHTPQ